jgi:hypothetical protein
MIRSRLDPSRIHLLLTVPPSFWAAFFLLSVQAQGELI